MIGSFVIDFAAPVPDIQSGSMELIEEVAAKREKELVDEVIAGWKRGSGATVGLSDTLAALQEHRISVLLTGVGFEASGYRCQHCRYLMLTEREECPLCGGTMAHVDDLVDTMTHRAFEQGVEVEVVRGSKKMDDVGAIGGLLRY